MSFVHSLDLLHGDIKPPNVLGKWEGPAVKVQLADFGGCAMEIIRKYFRCVRVRAQGFHGRRFVPPLPPPRTTRLLRGLLCVRAFGHGSFFVDPQANPSEREPLSEKEVGRGIPFQTLGYRAPEVLFGSPAYGKPADIFSLGVTLVQMAGDVSLQGVAGKKMMQFDYAMNLLKKFGLPGSIPPDWRHYKATYPK